MKNRSSVQELTRFKAEVFTHCHQLTRFFQTVFAPQSVRESTRVNKHVMQRVFSFRRPTKVLGESPLQKRIAECPHTSRKLVVVRRAKWTKLFFSMLSRFKCFERP